MQAIIIAGGRGTRISSITTTIPKALLPFNGEPLIDYTVNYLIKNGYDDIIICAGHLGYVLEEHIKSNNYGVKVRVSIETEPLGTAGGLNLIQHLLEDEFLVLFGDIYTTINLNKMFKFHKSKKADVTLALHISDHPQDSTVVEINKDGKLLKFIEKPGENWKKYGNLTKTSIYIMKKIGMDFIPKDRKADFDDVFKEMLNAQKNLLGYITSEYAKDMGTPQRFIEVQEYIAKNSQ